MLNTLSALTLRKISRLNEKVRHAQSLIFDLGELHCFQPHVAYLVGVLKKKIDLKFLVTGNRETAMVSDKNSRLVEVILTA